ncbi:MAG: ABC transporter ATP-binding protein [Christensenellales bacterium]
MNRFRMKAMLGYLKPYWLPYALSIFLAFTTTALGFIAPKVQSFLVDQVLGGTPFTGAAWLRNIIESIGGIPYLARNLWICAGLLVVLNVINSLLNFLRSRWTAIASENMAKSLREDIYDRLQRLPYDYHVKAETGDLIQRSTTDVETVRRFIANQLIELGRVVVMLIIAAVLLVQIHPLLTLFSMSTMPLLVVYSIWSFKRIENASELAEKADGALSTVMQENFTGVRVVRAFGRESFEEEKFTDYNEEYREKSIKLNRIFATFWAGSDVFSALPMLVVVTGGIYLAAKGSLTLGEYVVFLSYMGMMMWPIRRLGRILGNMSRTLIAMGRITDILHQKEENSGEDPQKPDLRGEIVFDRVSFSYGDKQVLRDMSFTIHPGETIAILGATGSGKSTLAHLLQRLYDYDSGLATISGVDIKNIDKSWLRSRVGIVLQEPFLYARTIKENIGITQTIPDNEAIYEAARVASLHDVIQSFDKGYDTMVGERGVTLSGGQKQRVAIARTILRENDVLIFDDSLSAVDTQTDAAIRKALQSRRSGITTIIISHRVSTLMEADRIFVMENGTITQQGTHEELINRDGLYRRIWDIQNAIEQEETEGGEANG